MTKLNPPIDLTDHARCLTCGYALRGLPVNRCPECGRTFDPANWRTMRVANRNAIRPLMDSDRALLAPQRSMGQWLPCALLVLLLLLTQYPGDIWPPFFCWSVLSGVALYPREKRAHQRRRVVRECGLDQAVLKVHKAVDQRLRGWALAAFVLILFRVPFLFNLAISGPSLDRFADRLYNQDPANEYHPPRMVGLFFVHGIDVEPTHIDFLMAWPLVQGWPHSDTHPAAWDEIIWYKPDFKPDKSVVLHRHLPVYYQPLPDWYWLLFPQLN